MVQNGGALQIQFVSACSLHNNQSHLVSHEAAPSLADNRRHYTSDEAHESGFLAR